MGATRVMQRTGAGILPVDITPEGDDYRVTMTQGRIEFGAPLDSAQSAALLTALDLTEADLLQNCPIEIVSTGHSKVMIGMRDSTLLNQLQPNYDALTALSARIRCNGYYVFTLNPEGNDLLVQNDNRYPLIALHWH